MWKLGTQLTVCGNETEEEKDGKENKEGWREGDSRGREGEKEGAGREVGKK